MSARTLRLAAREAPPEKRRHAITVEDVELAIVRHADRSILSGVCPRVARFAAMDAARRAVARDARRLGALIVERRFGDLRVNVPLLPWASA